MIYKIPYVVTEVYDVYVGADSEDDAYELVRGAGVKALSSASLKYSTDGELGMDDPEIVTWKNVPQGIIPLMESNS